MQPFTPTLLLHCFIYFDDKYIVATSDSVFEMLLKNPTSGGTGMKS